jgi:DNA-directed RNA polymerase
MTVAHEPLLADSNVERQVNRERQALEDGISRYRRSAKDVVDKGNGADLSVANRLLNHWLEPITLKLQDDKRAFIKTGYVRNISVDAMVVLCDMDPERVAFLAAKAACNTLMQNAAGETATIVSFNIARHVLADYNIRKLKRERGASEWREIRNRIRRLTPKNVQAGLRPEYDDGIFSIKLQLSIGSKLLHMLVDYASVRDYEDEFTPAFEVSRRVKSKRPVAWVEMSDDCHRLLWEGHKAREVLWPLYQPMVCQPWPWVNDTGRPGGFLVNRTPLIAKFKSAQRDSVDDATLDKVKHAVDAQGRVPRRVNKRVYEVAAALWDRGGGFAGQPPVDDIPRPPMPSGYNRDADRGFRWANVSKQDRKEWGDAATRVHRENNSIRGARSAYYGALTTSRSLLDEDRFWFPHQIDFRGRCYPMSRALHHQHGDAVRSMLEFADGKKAGGPEAQRWLEIHTANCAGVDKVSFEARQKWVSDHAGDIERVARDPLGYQWWMEAADPWQFLAACFALNDPKAAAHLPVGIDGTCNGLQWYSAMMRDRVGGALVNLIPGREPTDVYSDVLDAMLPVIADDRDPVAQHAYAYLQTLERRKQRKVVKTPIMTSTYGVTPSGVRGQIREQLRDTGFDVRTEAGGKAVGYLSRAVMDAIGDRIPGAARAMKWIRRVADILGRNNRHMEWHAPSGMKIMGWYGTWGDVRVTTAFGRLAVPNYSRPPKRVAIRKTMNASAPNFVHSIDASHLMDVSIECDRLGLDLGTRHDCYEGHAANMDQLGGIIRESFVRIAQLDPMARLHGEIVKNHPDLDIPDLPKYGTLDVGAIGDSPYLFS